MNHRTCRNCGIPDRNMSATLCICWKHRKQHLLFETQKARLSEDQEAAANYKLVSPLRIENENYNKEIRKIRGRLRMVEAKKYSNERKIYQFTNMLADSEHKKKKKFIRKCPDTNSILIKQLYGARFYATYNNRIIVWKI